jgi:hypothetical protein
LRRAWTTNNLDAIGKIVIDQRGVLIGAGSEGCIVKANAID